MSLISFEVYLGITFKNKLGYLWFFLASLLEPFLYHPLNVFFSLRGYLKHILGTQMVWGNMTRKGFAPEPGTVVAAAPDPEGEAVDNEGEKGGGK